MRGQNEAQRWREAEEPTGKPSLLVFMFLPGMWGLEGGVISAGILWSPWD